ncbi:Trp biosynthesis-associated membrane protein [Brachybacterium sp. FME24]|uniref:Trp biosynthesis-associated membrane protein n=1 Tax=Brachybacterium sp. FME24 TaxID=2742605 RepID=UPI001D0235F2|nr:Trp biosynthesis-associated membrane protein [Brachybacterium sp. FME24]
MSGASSTSPRSADGPRRPEGDAARDDSRIAEGRPRSGRRMPSRRVTVLAGTAASALLIGATRTTWAEATAPDLTGTSQSVAVTGSEAAPAVLALAVVAIAAALASSLSSTWVRYVTGPVLIAAGLSAAWSAIAAALDPIGAAGSAVTTATGVLGSEVDAVATPWPLLALIPAAAVAAVGVIVLVAGRSWPVGTRYRSAAVAAPSDPARDPAAAWDALTRGEDPSIDNGGSSTGDDGPPEPGTTPDPRRP